MSTSKNLIRDQKWRFRAARKYGLGVTGQVCKQNVVHRQNRLKPSRRGNIGRDRIADDITKTMTAAGYAVPYASPAPSDSTESLLLRSFAFHSVLLVPFSRLDQSLGPCFAECSDSKHHLDSRAT